ncbi:MAG: hypothetical protein IT306_14650 [Chloroflexi bacterium]|nr:hypothetical protein [Chloroflexota bacterium]
MATDTQAMAVVDERRDLTTADPEQAATALAHILATGDLAKLTNEQRVAYYLEQCRSLGLNSLSRPFDWLMLDNKLVLYPNKSCAEQLRRQHQISVRVIRREVVGDLFVCEVEGRRPNGVTDQASKYVPLTGYSKERGSYKLTGEKLANAFAKAETGAKRRLVLSMIGLSSPPDLDEMERVKVVTVDGTGRILTDPTQTQRALAADPGMARTIREPIYEDMDTGPSVLGATADQSVHASEVERPRAATTERPVLRCDAAKQRAAYFAAVDGTPLADDDGRAQFLREYTARYSPALRTDSLSRFLSYSGDRQASEMVQSAKLKAEAWRLSQAIGEPSHPVVDVTPEVHAAVLLTGGGQPQTVTVEAAAPGRPEHGGEYTADQWRAYYRTWAGELRKRDTAYTVWPESQVRKASMAALVEEVWSCIGQVDSIDEMEMLADLDASRDEDGD